MAKKEVARRSDVAPTKRELPEYLQTYVGETGLEELNQQDLVIPRLALCQSMSPQRKKGNALYIEDLEEGQFFNTVTREIYGEGPLDVTPLFVFKSRIFFLPMESGGGIRCLSPDGQHCALNNGGPCTRDTFGADGTKPDCSILYNYPVVIHGRPLEPLVVSLKSAGVKVAKTWNSMMRLRGGPVFSGIYRMEAVIDKNKAGQEYYQLSFSNMGRVTPEFFAEALKLYTNLKGRGRTIQADVTGLDEEHSGEM